MTRDQVIAIMGSPPNQVKDSELMWQWVKVNGLTYGSESRIVRFKFDESGKTIEIPEGGMFRNIINVKTQ